VTSETTAKGSATRDILTHVGTVPFEWSAADDRLRMGANALDVLGLARFEDVATGTQWQALLDAATPRGRSEALARTVDTDQGEGVAYETRYAIRPTGVEGPLVALHEVGRWYSDGRGKPARVHGVIRRLEAQDTIDMAAGTDALTGEMDRSGLTDALKGALASTQAGGAGIAFLIAAIDTLDQVNETFGKAIGDEVLIGVVQRMKERLRGGDVIGRIGGNRFAVILSNCDDEASSIAGQRFAAAVREAPIETGVGPLWVTLSLGAVAIPSQARTLTEALERADEANRKARRQGPGGLVVYRRNRHSTTLRLENRETAQVLSQLIGDGRVVMTLHPVRRAGEAAVSFCRVLPYGEMEESGGLVDLSDAAARLGLGTQLDLRVLELAAEHLGRDETLRLSVDVGLMAVATGAWTELGRAFLGREPDLAGRLDVALSSECLQRLPKQSAEFAETVRGWGASLSVHDYAGAGRDFSSALTLNPGRCDLSADVIRDILTGAASSRSVALVALARSLGAHVMARGAFTTAEVAALVAAGVDLIEDAGAAYQPAFRMMSTVAGAINVA
jgi:diguanylate cyclase (GGDEF)-like protein